MTKAPSTQAPSDQAPSDQPPSNEAPTKAVPSGRGRSKKSRPAALLPLVVMLGLLAPVVLVAVLVSRTVRRSVGHRYQKVHRAVFREVQRWR